MVREIPKDLKIRIYNSGYLLDDDNSHVSIHDLIDYLTIHPEISIEELRKGLEERTITKWM
jgi:hypothetical protein